MEKNNFDSIQEQVDSAIRASFVAGTDEQASNGEAGHQEGRHRIHTNSRLNDLLTLSRKAFQYIKSQHNDILCIKDVTVGHINDFLESKAGGLHPVNPEDICSNVKKDRPLRKSFLQPEAGLGDRACSAKGPYDVQ